MAKKLLIGCAVAALVGAVLFSVALFLGARWLGGKAEQLGQEIEQIAGGERVDQLSAKYPFQPPAEKLLTESQLQRFQNVRRALDPVVERYKPEFERLSKVEAEKEPRAALGVVRTGWSFFKDLRAAQLDALETQKMSPEEYKFVAEQVYAAWWRVLFEEAGQGQTMEQMAEKGSAGFVGLYDQLLARQELTPERRAELERAREATKKLAGLFESQVKAAEAQWARQAPPENVELIRRHRAEFERHPLIGLELLGF
jgi:hypothetical protein